MLTTISGSVVCFFLLATAIAQPDQDQPFDYAGYEILHVAVGNENQANELKLIGHNLQVELWNEPNTEVGYSLLQVPPFLKTVIRNVLQERGFNYTVAIEDFQNAIDHEREENRPKQRGVKRDLRSFDYGRYRQLNEITSFLDQVEREYPHLAKKIDIGTTYEGKRIYGLRITAAAPGTKPVVFLECGIHAREWITVAASLYFIGQLTTKSTDPTIAPLINNFEWQIIPTTNPDGYHYTQTRNRSWRKTRSQSRLQPACYGADPNRNFATAFCTVGASKTPCSETYCGDYAFSEKETQALKNYLTTLGSRLKVYFGIHSFGQLWMYPYGYTTAQPGNAKQLRDIAVKSTQALWKRYNTQYKLGTISQVIYPASGSSVDWVYDTLGVKVAYALELRDTGLYGFMLPARLILPTAEETFEGIKTTVLNA